MLPNRLTIIPSQGDLEAILLVARAFSARYTRGLSLLSTVRELLVTHEEGLIQVQGSIGSAADGLGDSYAAYIDESNFVCGCLDNLGRKCICKHLLALVLAAYEEESINAYNVLELLQLKPLKKM